VVHWLGGDAGRRVQRSAVGATTTAPTSTVPPPLAALATGSWGPSSITALAGLFGAGNGGRVDTIWAQIASQPGLANQAQDVADLARIRGWGDALVVNLATAFGAQAGGRSAADWAAVAAADLNLVDQVPEVAALARAGWQAPDVATTVAALVAAAPSVGSALGLLVPNVVISLKALADDLGAGRAGTFVGGLLADTATAGTVPTLVGDKAFVAAVKAMAGAGWQPADLASFTAAALGSGATVGQLVGLIKRTTFPGVARATAKTWPASRVGEFCGAGLAAQSGPAAVEAALNGGDPSAVQPLLLAGLTHAEVGVLVSTAERLGASLGYLRTVLPTGRATVDAVRKLWQKTWTAPQLAAFVSGAGATGLAGATLGSVIGDAKFADASVAWRASPFNAQGTGAVVGEAIKAGMSASQAVAFLAEANAAANAAALTWTPTQVGQTVAALLKVKGAPKMAELVQALGVTRLFQAHGATPARLLAAAREGPVWAAFNAHAPTFGAQWKGTTASKKGPMAQAVCQGDATVTVEVRNWLWAHVEQRHTYEHTDWSRATLTRPPQQFTFFAANTKVQPLLLALPAQAAVQAAAVQAKRSGASQPAVAAPGLLVRVGQPGPEAGEGATANMQVTQCYPSAGTTIGSATLLAIGQLLGATK
jgi:hypothetical protein